MTRRMADNCEAVGSNLELRFEASMVLAGVGDALGYKNGSWEFCRSGERIHAELAKLGGLDKISVNARDWMISDDTVMHIATAEALASSAADDWISDRDQEKLYAELALRYKKCMDDMAGRAPGLTCGASAFKLKPSTPKGYVIPFNPKGGGCGGSMRSAPIGLLFWKPEDVRSLIIVSIESGRMTHNHPTGYLGSLATALFVSYAVQRKPLREWGRGLLDVLEPAWKYVEESGRDVKENKAAWGYFKGKWTDYLSLRGILDGESEPSFPKSYGVKERDVFYKSVSFNGVGGASGHDSTIIAYDALLGCNWSSWDELCLRGMLHGGDSDSTGIIVGACWGAWRGFKGVPEAHYKQLEYRDRLRKLAKQLLEKSQKA